MIEFAQPTALWTGLLVGLPVLAHMAYRRVTEKFYFPSLRFIRPSQIPRTGKRTPSDIPLLLLRILLFLILSALLADPYWKSEAKPVDKLNRNETVIAIDLSPSMAGWGGLEEAKEISISKLDKMEGAVGLITFDHSKFETLEVGTEISLINEKVSKLEHSWIQGNAQLMLDRVSKMFSENATGKKLIVLSDFQKSDWQTAFLDMKEIGIACELVKVGDISNDEEFRSNNISIVEARAVPAGPNKIRVWSVIRNWDDESKNIDLELIAGEKIQEKKSLSVPPLGSVQSQFVLKEGDFAKATVRLSQEDELLLDNKREIWLKAPPARRFGFWIPSFENDETDEEKSFLKTAVSSSGDNGWNRWIWDQDQADGLRSGDEQVNLNLLLVPGVGKWFETEELAAVVKSYLGDGGVVLFTPAEPFSLSFSILKGAGLLDFNFARVAGGASRSGNPFRIGVLDQSSLLSEVFDGKASRDLYLSAIHKFGILRDAKGSENFEIPLKDREGRPLAVVKKFDSGGRMIFLPFRMSTSWTDLPLRNSFLPLLMELVQGGANSSVEGWPVLKPGGILKGGQDDFVANEPGAYRFEDQWLEVVMSSSESTPYTLTETEINEILDGALKVSEVNDLVYDSKNGEENPLWMWFAFAAVCILIIEIFWSRPKSNLTVSTNSIHA